jgi:hypothetical protein
LNQTKTVASYLILSIIGAAFLLSIVSQAPRYHPTAQFQDKILVSCLFIFVCIIGILCTLRPNWMKSVDVKKRIKTSEHSKESSRCFRGHHPDCARFESHRITYKNTTWCAGCLGLMIGGAFAIFFMILYLIIPFQQPLIVSHLLLFSGLLLIVIVFIEIYQGNSSSLIHLVSNCVFIISFFFITESMMELTGNVVYGFFTILLCLLWLDTRIILSKWTHSRLCESCLQSCKVYVVLIIYGK